VSTPGENCSFGVQFTSAAYKLLHLFFCDFFDIFGRKHFGRGSELDEKGERVQDPRINECQKTWNVGEK
jgi:hypothetical protein